jgi:hypothetical protein
LADAAEVQEQEHAEQQSLFTFEGRSVQGRQIRFTGTVALDDQGELLQIGDLVEIKVFGTVTGINHERRPKLGLVRDQKVVVDDLEVLSVGREAELGVSVSVTSDEVAAIAGDEDHPDNVRDLPLGASADEDDAAE